MARPKLGESESKRLQMVITDAELTAIEDWQFANRVPSKSEAIRRLCQIGLLANAEIRPLKDRVFDIYHEIEARYYDCHRQFEELIGPNTQRKFDEATSEALLENLNRISDDLDGAEELLLRVTGLANAIEPLTGAKTVSEGEKLSNDAIDAINERLHQFSQRRNDFEDNHRLVKVWASMTPVQIAAYQEMSPDERDAYLEQAKRDLSAAEEKSERGQRL